MFTSSKENLANVKANAGLFDSKNMKEQIEVKINKNNR
jgi:hypothetical protein